MNRNEAHLRLLLPYDEALPPTLGGALADIPAIWRRAQTFFARVIDHIGSIRAFALRPVLKRDERTNLLDRLKPVERIVRAVLVMRALAYLMMTPEGMRLRRDTQKLVWPPPKAGAQPEAESETGNPGEAQLRRRAIADHPAAASALSIDCSEPAERPSPFHVLRLRLPEEEAGEDEAEENERGNGEAEEERDAEKEPCHPGDEEQPRRRAGPPSSLPAVSPRSAAPSPIRIASCRASPASLPPCPRGRSRAWPTASIPAPAGSTAITT